MMDARLLFSNFGTGVDIFAPGAALRLRGHGEPATQQPTRFQERRRPTPHRPGQVLRLYSWKLIRRLHPQRSQLQSSTAQLQNKVGNPGTGSPTGCCFLVLTGAPPPANSDSCSRSRIVVEPGIRIRWHQLDRNRRITNSTGRRCALVDAWLDGYEERIPIHCSSRSHAIDWKQCDTEFLGEDHHGRNDNHNRVRQTTSPGSQLE